MEFIILLVIKNNDDLIKTQSIDFCFSFPRLKGIRENV